MENINSKTNKTTGSLTSPILKASEVFAPLAKIEISQEKNQKIENRFIGNVTLRSGRKLWCYNPTKEEMREVKISKVATVSFVDSMAIDNPKAEYDPSCLYFQAINETNGWRKLKQYRDGNLSVLQTFEKKEPIRLPQMF